MNERAKSVLFLVILQTLESTMDKINICPTKKCLKANRGYWYSSRLWEEWMTEWMSSSCSHSLISHWQGTRLMRNSPWQSFTRWLFGLLQIELGNYLRDQSTSGQVRTPCHKRNMHVKIGMGSQTKDGRQYQIFIDPLPFNPLLFHYLFLIKFLMIVLERERGGNAILLIQSLSGQDASFHWLKIDKNIQCFKRRMLPLRRSYLAKHVVYEVRPWIAPDSSAFYHEL